MVVKDQGPTGQFTFSSGNFWEVLGTWLGRSCYFLSEQDVEYFLDFDKKGIRWPEQCTSDESVQHVDKQQTLSDQMSQTPDLLDLAKKCLIYDPAKRLTAKQALKHAFINDKELRTKYLRKGIDVLNSDSDN